MAKPVIMPKLGFTQDSSEIVRWLKQAGDAVEQGDPLVEVTTDKVNMEVEAPVSGILDGIRFQVGAVVPVTEIICYIRAPGEPPVETQPRAPGKTQVPPAPEQPPLEAVPTLKSRTEPPAPARATPVAANLAQQKGIDLQLLRGTGPGGRITKQDVDAFQPSETIGTGQVRAVPSARRLARELGIAIESVTGSGPNGRIQSGDVRAEQAKRVEPTTAPHPPLAAGQFTIVKRIPLTGMRRTIATRMQQSAQQVPHITFDADIDVTAAQDLRTRINDLASREQPRVSLTAIIVKACAWALQRHPLINSRLEGDEIQLLQEINIGIAVALDEGLIVPVVKAIDKKGVTEIANDIAHVAERARQGRLQMQDLGGGTFTVSNLGMFGVDRFTAIINPPETAILAIGRVNNRFIPNPQNQPVMRPLLTATLSADHRVVDGAEAARFLSDLRLVLEHPELFVM